MTCQIFKSKHTQYLNLNILKINKMQTWHLVSEVKEIYIIYSIAHIIYSMHIIKK